MQLKWPALKHKFLMFLIKKIKIFINNICRFFNKFLKLIENQLKIVFIVIKSMKKYQIVITLKTKIKNFFYIYSNIKPYLFTKLFLNLINTIWITILRLNNLGKFYKCTEFDYIWFIKIIYTLRILTFIFLFILGYIMLYYYYINKCTL